MGNEAAIDEAKAPKAIITDLAENGGVPIRRLRQAAGCVNTLVEYGLERNSVWELAKMWKVHRIKGVGYRKYLKEILGSGVYCRLADCRLWRGEEELDIGNLSYWPGQPVIEYLCFLAEKCGSIDDLPDRIEVNREGKKLRTCI